MTEMVGTWLMAALYCRMEGLYKKLKTVCVSPEEGLPFRDSKEPKAPRKSVGGGRAWRFSILVLMEDGLTFLPL